jgi:hypothetical protein
MFDEKMFGCWTILPYFKCIYLLNVLVQIANKMGLKKLYFVFPLLFLGVYNYNKYVELRVSAYTSQHKPMF